MKIYFNPSYSFLLKTFIIIVFSWITSLSQSKEYFVDSQVGDDSFTGLTQEKPWKTLDKINGTTFYPGDKILFKADCKWEGVLFPKGSGSSSNPIVISKYGFGKNPLIAGNGNVTNTVYLSNQEFWTISNLEITNYKAGSTSVKRGVYINGRDYGTLHGIKLLNLEIHDVNSNIDEKNGGGIFIEITGSSKPTNFDNLLIEGCNIYDVDRTGISNASSWETRTLTSNTNWYPSTNLIIRNNTLERIAGNGLIVRVAANPLVEKNVFSYCSLKTSGNAMFSFNCDDAVFQFNEAKYTVYNPGDTDASGFDADYRCKRTIIQYNYSHDNDDGFVVVTCQGGSDRFNDGTIVRYNISQNDGGRGSSTGAIVYLSGQTTNTTIHNNVIYSDANNAFKKVIFHNSWSAYPDRTNYYNNIFYILRTPTYSFSSSTSNFFDFNLFYGLHSSTEPIDAHKITLDPKFVLPGGGYSGINSLDGYKLLPASPCIDAGKILNGHSPRDYFGFKVPGNSKVDIGAHEFNGTPVGINSHGVLPSKSMLIQNYPNPFNPSTEINYLIAEKGSVLITVYDVLGNEVATLVDEVKTPGMYKTKFQINNSSLSSGVYFCTLKTSLTIQTRKMLFIK